MSELTFTWNGKSTDDFGIEVTRLPDVVSPAIRGSTQTIVGRDGTLFIGDDALDEMALLVECYLPYEQTDGVASMDEIRAWLRGSGWFSQSDVPGRRMKARITDAISFQPLVVGFADRVFGVTLYADPYQYVYPEAKDAVFTASGTIENPGTAASRPKIILKGSGDITLTVGSCLMVFEGLTDGIVIDSELLDCLNLEENQLMNGCAQMDEFPTLQPGYNAISWSGSVASVTITPRWRYV